MIQLDSVRKGNILELVVMLILKLSRKMWFGVVNIGNISVLCDQQSYNFYSGIIQYLMNYHIYSLKSQVYLNLVFFFDDGNEILAWKTPKYYKRMMYCFSMMN